MLTWITLHDVDELPEPKHVAYAIADVARERLEAARRYLDEWAALRRSGVPAKFRRELLEDNLPAVEAMHLVRAWHGSSAPIVLIGAVGTGKSHALAWWALERHRAGELTRWESVGSWPTLDRAELRERHKRLVSCPGLVLDDIGAGGLAPWHRDLVEGLIMQRHADERPTAVALNATKRQAIEILGRRVIDRILGEGGVIKGIQSEDSLRRPPPPDLDGSGRTPTGLAHRWLLDAVGCVEVVSGPWDENGDPCEGEPERRIVYGDDLCRRLCTGGAWLAEADLVRGRAGASVREVVEAARAAAEAEESDPVMRLALGLLGRLREESQREAAAREQATHDAIQSRRPELWLEQETA